MRMSACGAAVLTFAVIGHALPAAAQVDQQRAHEYFKEAQALCERDGGRLWGVSLCGPMVIADLKTKTLATSQPAPDGPWPRFLGLVNAPIEWGGATWVAFNWDFVASRTPRDRRVLFIHESFHRVQPGLALMQPAAANEHVDAMDGRYWLRLEWRALARALQESGTARAAAVRDALAFRQARRALYAGSAEGERAVEITEGLPHYTGVVVAASSAADALATAVEFVAGGAAEAQESFLRTFPSTSGPAYGLLLDASSAGWRQRLRATDDLGALLMHAFGVQPADDATASAARYGGAEIRAAEEQRERQRQDRVAALRQQFLDGPVLVIPGGGSAGSDSRGAVVIPGSGTVYFGAFKASGPWGTLEAEKGVLVASDGRTRRVSVPVRRDDVTVTGDGWTFKAAAGWVIREGARRGDYEVVRAP
jgi:hypothetical protein